jgi:hypothetical protein
MLPQSTILARQATRYLKDHAKAVLLGSTASELRDLFAAKQLAPFRANQALSLIMRGARTMEELRLLPRADREILTREGVIVGRGAVDQIVSSVDGTKKVVTRLHDGLVVETAAIPTDARLTVCVSSQVRRNANCFAHLFRLDARCGAPFARRAKAALRAISCRTKS